MERLNTAQGRGWGVMLAIVALAMTSREPSASADPPNWGPVRLLNSTGILNDAPNAVPVLETDGAGTWIALWYAQGALRPMAFDILSARSANNGTSWSATAPLNVNASAGNGNHLHPAFATDGGNVWVAVWASNDTLGGTLGATYHILLSRSTNGGVSWTPPAALAPNAASQTLLHLNPRVATDRAGNWIAVWVTNEVALGGRPAPDPKFNVVYSRSVNNGVNWSAPAPLDSNAMTNTGSEYAPDIATDRRGNWLAVWDTDEPRFGASMSERDIGFARSANVGLNWTAARALNTDAATDTANDFAPRIGTDAANSTWVVVWYANAIGGRWGPDYDACTARSLNIGTADTWSDRAPLNSDAYVDGPSIADQRPMVLFDSGNWVAIWDKVGPNARNIMSATSTTGGRTWSTLGTVNSNASAANGDSTNPAVAGDGRGHLVAVWQSMDTLFGMIPRPHLNIFSAPGQYVCGDGHLDPGEECDNGAAMAMSCCTPQCRLVVGCDAGVVNASDVGSRPDAPDSSRPVDMGPEAGADVDAGPDIGPAGDDAGDGGEPLDASDTGGPTDMGDVGSRVDAGDTGTAAVPDVGVTVRPDASGSSSSGGGCSCGIAERGTRTQGGAASVALIGVLALVWAGGRKARRRPQS